MLCTVLQYTVLLCTFLLYSQHTHHPTNCITDFRIAILISVQSNNELVNTVVSMEAGQHSIKCITEVMLFSNGYSHLHYISVYFVCVGGSEEPCDGSLECCLDFHETASYPAAQRNMLANSSMQQV